MASSSDPPKRLAVGEEHDPVESPCPGCGAYYFAEHLDGCEYEECARCGTPVVMCGCDRRAPKLDNWSL
jgi:hypothetical protein